MRFLILLLASSMWASVIGDVRYKLATGDLTSADAIVAEFCRAQPASSECAAAVSWLARGAEVAKDYAQANVYADRTTALNNELLKRNSVESDNFLEISVGAVLEVRARLLADKGANEQAVALLNAELPKWKDAAIQARLRKNLNILTLVGTRAPVVYPEMQGKPALLFLWGHWCGDCAGQAPIMARIWKRYRSQGLVMVAPTRPSVPAADESADIERVWKANLSDVRHPVDEPAMLTYGVSSTPTLVLVDRKGIVRMYEPYRMSEEALAKRIDDLLQ
jgi:thiol-disulfide isomerase/thioredoxin